MSDNDLSSKLAKGMRRAKEPAPGSTTPAASTPAASAPHAPAATPSAAVQSHVRGTAGATPRAGGKRFAEQSDQAPPASLDRPWENLHPKRIWPD